MTSDQCRDLRALLGMHALGRLDPRDEVRLQAHLDGCPDCRAELRALRAPARALAQADPDRLSDLPAQLPTLRAAVFAAVDRERGRRRTRTTRVLAAAAAFVLLAGLGGVITYEVTPHGRALTFVAEPSGVHASASVQPRDWGTWIDLQVAGLPPGQRYLVWFERPDGSRMPAGSFTANGERTVSMQLAVAIRAADATTLGVSTPTDSRPILRAPLH